MKLSDKIIKKGLVSLFSLFTLLLLLTIGSNRFDQIDYGIYLEFTKSILDDGDLNVSNQLTPIRLTRNEPIIVTPKNYDPSYHPYSGSSLLVPVLSLSRYISPFFSSLVPKGEMTLRGGLSKEGDEIFSESILCVFNIVLVYLSFYLIYKFLLREMSIYRYVLLCHTFVFMTPLLNYTFFQPGNMNIPSFFFGTVSFILIKRRKEHGLNTFVVSLFLFTGTMIKYEVGLFLLLFLIMKVFDHRHCMKNLFREILVISISSIPVSMYFLTNNYHQFGELFLKYGGMTLQSVLSLELLFSPLHGYLFVSPFIILTFIAVFYYFKTIPHEILIFSLLVILKFFGESLTISSGIDFGARNYLSDMSVLFITFLFFENKFRSRWFYCLIGLSVIWTLSWNSLYFVFIPGLTLSSYFLSLSSAFSLILEKIVTLDISLTFSFVKFFFFLIFGFVLMKAIYFKRKSLYMFLGYFYLFSFLVMILNIKSNPSVPHEPYSKGRGSELWFYIENMSGYTERINRLNNYGDSSTAQVVSDNAITYKKRAEKQISEGQKQL